MVLLYILMRTICGVCIGCWIILIDIVLGHVQIGRFTSTVEVLAHLRSRIHHWRRALPSLSDRNRKCWDWTPSMSPKPWHQDDGQVSLWANRCNRDHFLREHMNPLGTLNDDGHLKSFLYKTISTSVISRSNVDMYLMSRLYRPWCLLCLWRRDRM